MDHALDQGVTWGSLPIVLALGLALLPARADGAARRARYADHTVSAAQAARYANEWDREVLVRGKTMTGFLQERGLNRADLATMRVNEPGRFEHTFHRKRTPHAMVLGFADVWDQQVTTLKWSVARFHDETGTPPGSIQVMRDQAPGRFLPAKGRVRTFTAPYVVTESDVDAARTLMASYQRGELGLIETRTKLTALGISDKRYRQLKSSDPAFASREVFLEANHDAMVAAVIAIGKAERASIQSVIDLFEVVNATPSFVSTYGKIPTDALGQNSLLGRDRRRKGALRGALRDELGLNRIGRTANHGARPLPAPSEELEDVGDLADDEDADDDDGPDLRRMARTLSTRLAKESTPDPERLRKVVAQLARRSPGFASEARVSKILTVYRELFPALRRWSYGGNRGYDLRYVVGFAKAMHDAGPGATWDEINAIFARTPEAQQDGRIPEDTNFLGWAVKRFPGLATSWSKRRTWQLTRTLIEDMRTAPAGTSLHGVLKGQARGLTQTTAKNVLASLDEAKLRDLGFDPALLARLRRGMLRGKVRGLGEAPDAAFDANLEPPGFDLARIQALADIPRIPPLLRRYLDRLDGQRPFAGHQALFVYHRYSDIVPFVETMIAAGLRPARSRFVTTPYPFHDATKDALELLGVPVIDHAPTLEATKAAVADQIRELLEKPAKILIVDDGGIALDVVRTQFRDQIHRFKIAEITQAGHRLADDVKKEFKRMPLVYGSIARDEVKRKITSGFHAERVVDRVIDVVRQAGLTPPTRKVVVIGAGAMGEPAILALERRARELRRSGLELVIVDDDPDVATKFEGRFEVQPMDQALRGAGLVLGMVGKPMLGLREMELLPDGAILAQGSSKRTEFDMPALEAIATKTLLPRTDGLPQKSYTYAFAARGKTKRLHVLADGWTINHDGSLHGTPMHKVQLELAILLDNVTKVARTQTRRTGKFLVVSPEEQQEWVKAWEDL